MMNDRKQAPDRNGWWIASGAVLAVALVTLAGLGSVPYSGFTASGGTLITQVRADSPAEAAGFEVGDKILVAAGIQTEDLKAVFRQPRAEIGETRHYVVEREGADEPIDLSVAFTQLPPDLEGLTFGAALIGLAFLVAGVGAYLRFPNPTSRLLAFLGVSGLFAFVGLPYIPQATLRLAAATLPLMATLLMSALLLHFLLLFPRRRPFLDRAIAKPLIYWPIPIVGLLVGVTLLFKPELLQLTVALISAVPVLQILFSIGILIHSYVKASSAVRSSTGLHALLIGFLGGLLPVVVAGFVPSLPGATSYFLTTILIPISLAYAVFKVGERSPREALGMPVEAGVNAGGFPWVDR